MKKKNMSRRPFAVTCLFALVLTLSGLQAIKLWAVISSWDALTNLPLSVSPLYLGASAFVWLIVGAVLAYGLWQAKAWAPRAILWATIVYVAMGWLDRLLMQAKGPQQSNWLFAVGLSVILMASVIGILTLPKVRAYFWRT